jgi:ribose transport system permease protein
MNSNNSEKSKGNILKNLFRSREIGIFVVFIVICIILAIASPKFLLISNLTNVARQMAVIAIISVGMTYVIITGGIDLSVGSIVAFSGCITALMLVDGYPIALCILVGLLLGTIVGFVNGLLIVYVKLAPFIATLGTMGIARGLVLAITRGYPIQPFPKAFEWIGRGYLGVFPIPVLIMAVIVIIGYVLLSKTKLGRHIYYIGSNEKAARLSGLNVDATLIFVYTIAGFFSGLASVVLISRLTSAQSNMGSGFELDAIAAVVIGGTSLSGGEGSVLGSLIGAALMGIIKNALILLGVNVYWQSVVIGLVIVLAVSIDAFRKSKRKISFKKLAGKFQAFNRRLASEKKFRLQFIVITTMVVALAALGLILLQRNGGFLSGREQNEDYQPTTMPVFIDPDRYYALGEEVVVCDNQLTIVNSGYEELNNATMIVVSVLIDNQADRQVPINSFDFTAVDTTGKIYTDVAIGRIEQPLGSDRIDPGSQIEGAVAFTVPDESTELIMIWQPGWCTSVAYMDIFE